MIPQILSNTVNLDIAWLLGVLAILAGCICTLAGIIYAIMQKQISSMRDHQKNQDKLIGSQSLTIDRLQIDVDRMSGGCGLDACHWKKR